MPQKIDFLYSKINIYLYFLFLIIIYYNLFYLKKIFFFYILKYNKIDIS